MNKREIITSWGRYPRSACLLTRPERYAMLIPSDDICIARGQGRSYGDCALNTEHSVILTERVNRLLSFDDKRGILRAEAGVTLAELLEVFVPRGWFLQVTPGTKHVSLGGCIAADVHGKNHHHDGTFSSSLLEIELVLADGSYRRCSPAKDPELFWATVGGMGLTGIITEATLKLRPVETAYIVARHYGARDLDETIRFLDEAHWDDKYTVAWIDCLVKGGQMGRSIVMAGHHAIPEDLPTTVRSPLIAEKRGERNLHFDLPKGILNSWTVKAFNNIYYRLQSSKKGAFITDYDHFFYPLDGIGNWNRMYGKSGFIQYQCVIPLAHSLQGLKLLLEELTGSRRPSFLAVLKRMGKEGPGLLSFPDEGYTLAIDIPLTDPEVFPFLDRLDDIVLKHGGRIYLAKDARLREETFRAMYPRLSEWQKQKNAVDPDSRFASDMSRRLGMAGFP